jgi:7,8-dihydroneopterin aldolase/epimerase/oxygenase
VITIEVNDFRLFGHHGVHAHEKENGQDFVFDVALDVGDRGSDDVYAEAVDYREVQRVVQEINDARSYDLIEALATAVADALWERFAPEAVRVRVTKPAVKPGVVSVSASRP